MTNCGCAREVKDYIVPVVKNTKLSERIFWMTFEAPEAAREAKAGQCLMVFPSSDGGHMLGRPFEAADAAPERGEVSVCYMTAGRGTELLSRVKEGTRLKIRAFLGVPYPQDHGPVIMAGGGVGIAGFLLAKKQSPRNSSLYVGMPGRGYEKFAEHILSIDAGAKIFTDDGSFGEGDSIFKALPRPHGGDEQVWCCGPTGFLRAMLRHCEASPQSLYFSLDRRMACGYGGCMGCVVETSGGARRICVDQSLFRADEVELNDD